MVIRLLLSGGETVRATVQIPDGHRSELGSIRQMRGSLFRAWFDAWFALQCVVRCAVRSSVRGSMRGSLFSAWFDLSPSELWISRSLTIELGILDLQISHRRAQKLNSSLQSHQSYSFRSFAA